MAKKLTQVMGIVLVIIGILGFIPGVTTDGLLFGTFSVNAAWNIMYIIIGLIGLYVSMSAPASSKMYLQIFGVIFAIWAILGFVYGDSLILGFIANNSADNWLHVVIALVSLYGGFMGNDAA